ncbi:helix-turn-helix domain-containing protein [Salinimicrobium sp. CAU 1759]|jgi:predicted DNA-binding transcriptional regulator AlpA
MPTSIITTDDLREFKMELLEELKELLNIKSGSAPKKWLKSTDVMKMLKISPGTLQNLRVNGTLPYTKIGGLIYYDASEIERVMQENKVCDFQ